jgi:uncharacterized membrane protein HdeD (DUF308 family)
MWLESPRTLAARGLLALVLGALLTLWPGMSLSRFALIFGVFAIVDGGLLLYAAALTRVGEGGRSITTFVGAAAVILGIVTFVWPGLRVLAMLSLVAIRALIVGTAEVAACVYLWREGAPRSLWVIGCAGTLSLVFGILLLAFSEIGLLTLLSKIGVYAITIGLLSIVVASSSHR